MKRIYINEGWRFYREADPAVLQGERCDFEIVRLPHANVLLPYNCAQAEAYQFISGYERTLSAPLSWSGMRVFVTFEGAAHRAEVFLNGEKLAAHSCGYTAFTVELTEMLRLGDENTLSVRLDSRETLNQPPFGGRIDYLTYGGLYREAYIELAGETFISDVFAATPETDELRCKVSLDGPVAEGMQIEATLMDDGAGKNDENDENDENAKAFIKKYPVSDSALCFSETVENAKKWSVDDPRLYTLKLTLFSAGGESLDEKSVRFGFRTVRFTGNGFYLNGQKLKLRGLNRHQSYPYIGYAAPESLQRFDADVLKNELGCNAVRTSHYPQSRHFLDRCDEIGLLVFTEIPGWQHIGDETWKDEAVNNVCALVRQYRNHPSIFLWGVRINESPDDDGLYIRTNAAAHKLDDTRPTSGVRYLEKSSLLEDVYAYNDFSHTGDNAGLRPKKAVTGNPDKGYIVSEYNGHMFPTKQFDCEERRLAQACRHAQVLEAMYANADIGGCIGWCMADYNTHADFGSGDGICYHGVLDMFRNPKLAAAVYRSQAEGKTMLRVSSSMNIGEYPAGRVGDVYAFTNADSVRLYRAGEFVKEFLPDRVRFGHMPHPPVVIDDLIGGLIEKNEKYPPKTVRMIREILLAVSKYGVSNLPLRYKTMAARLTLFHGISMAEGVRLYNQYVDGWGGEAQAWRFEAVRDEKVAAVVEEGAVDAVRICAKADHTQLSEKTTYDMAIVRIEARDGAGNRVSYFQEPVELTTQGPIEIVGPAIISLKGGAFGTLVKTLGLVGEAKLTLNSPDAEGTSIDFTVF